MVPSLLLVFVNLLEGVWLQYDGTVSVPFWWKRIYWIRTTHSSRLETHDSQNSLNAGFSTERRYVVLEYITVIVTVIIYAVCVWTAVWWAINLLSKPPSVSIATLWPPCCLLVAQHLYANALSGLCQWWKHIKLGCSSPANFTGLCA